jgi:hypothetical protein
MTFLGFPRPESLPKNLARELQLARHITEQMTAAVLLG